MNRNRTAAALLAAVMSLSVAACGEETASSVIPLSAAPSRAVSSAVSAAPAAKSAVKVTFALDPDTAAPLLGGLYTAEAEGYFSKCGLDVTFQTAASAADAAQLAAAGTVQFTTAGQSTAFAQALTSDKPLTAVAALLQHSDAGILLPAPLKITRPKQLENVLCQTAGKSLPAAKLATVVTADGGNAALLKASAEAGTSLTAVLKAGTTAVCGSYSWDGMVSRQAGISANFLFFRDVSPELDDYPLLLAANSSFLKKQPQAAKDFVTAVKMGYAYAAAHPENTASLVCSKVPALQNQKSLVQRSLIWLAGKYTDDAARWGQLDTARWNRFYTWMNQNKLTSKAIPLGTGVTNTYLQ